MRAAFEHHAGMSPAEASFRLQKLEGHLRNREFGMIAGIRAPLKELGLYFVNARAGIRETEKDPKKRRELEKEVAHCAETAIDLAGLLTNLLG